GIMTLEEYSNIIDMAFKIEGWNYSKIKKDNLMIFSIRFTENGKIHTDCKVFVYNDGICDMDVGLPFICPENRRVELSNILTNYNYSKRYATIRLDLSNGKIVNSYSFNMLPFMPPEYVLNIFNGVREIEKDIYKSIQDICELSIEEEIQPEIISVSSDKRNKFKIEL
ncbi:MAG: hypothetical protein Q4D54_07815, partial [Eubacteriales bacterium]|nr:hypothetical protein [Eubacteriales bacterium]